MCTYEVHTTDGKYCRHPQIFPQNGNLCQPSQNVYSTASATPRGTCDFWHAYMLKKTIYMAGGIEKPAIAIMALSFGSSCV